MDPDTIVRICQSEQKGFCLLFLFHLFGLIISTLFTCLLLFHVTVVSLQQTNPCVWTNVARSIYARHGFSDLTKLPGEEQVDIIAWGTQVRKNIWVFPKKYGNPSKSSIFIGFSIINHPFLGTPIFGNTHFFSCECSKIDFGMIILGGSKIGKSCR